MKETLKWAIKQRDKTMKSLDRAIKCNRPTTDIINIQTKIYYWNDIISKIEGMD